MQNNVMIEVNDLICTTDYVAKFILAGPQPLPARQGLPGWQPVHLSRCFHVLWDPSSPSKLPFHSLLHVWVRHDTDFQVQLVS